MEENEKCSVLDRRNHGDGVNKKNKKEIKEIHQVTYLLEKKIKNKFNFQISTRTQYAVPIKMRVFLKNNGRD